MTEDAPARLKHMADTPTPGMDQKLAPTHLGGINTVDNEEVDGKLAPTDEHGALLMCSWALHCNDMRHGALTRTRFWPRLQQVCLISIFLCLINSHQLPAVEHAREPHQIGGEPVTSREELLRIRELRDKVRL